MAKWLGNHYKPRPGWHDWGSIAPPRPIARGLTPPQLMGANQPAPIAANPRQSPPANKPTRPYFPGLGANRNNRNNRQTRANQPGPIARGQPPPKQSPNRWGPIAPQTGQPTNPGQPPAKPKQPRKRAFEVSAHLLSKAKKTPVLPGVVLVLRQFPIIANIKL
jgi:hypothetical protein